MSIESPPWHPAGALGDDVTGQWVAELALLRHHAQVLVHVPLQLLPDVQLGLGLLGLQVVEVELAHVGKSGNYPMIVVVLLE